MCGGGQGFHLFPFLNNDSQNYQGTKHTGYRIPKGGKPPTFSLFSKTDSIAFEPNGDHG